jgi:hypothetical protein
MGRIRSVFAFSVLFVLAPGISAQIPSDPAPAEAPETGFTLGQNYINLFDPETRIPFELNEGLFSDGGTAVVSVRILNVILQHVASPTARNHPGGQAPLVDLEYANAGRYEAYWDGLDLFGRELASGTYWVVLTVNDAQTVGRMYVAK